LGKVESPVVFGLSIHVVQRRVIINDFERLVDLNADDMRDVLTPFLCDRRRLRFRRECFSF
jgi:hypothetical protein